MWLQFWADEGIVRQRDAKDLPPTSSLIAPPYDARLGTKRATRRTGSKLRVTETGDDHKVNLMTHAATAKPNRHDIQQVHAIDEA